MRENVGLCYAYDIASSSADMCLHNTVSLLSYLIIIDNIIIMSMHVQATWARNDVGTERCGHKTVWVQNGVRGGAMTARF